MEFTPKYNATIDNMPQLPYAIEEAVNRLRVNLSFQGSKVRKIMVVSTVPDEGKSFVSMLLEGERLRDSLNELAENYRYVIIDAPPLNLVSDGEKIGSLCDGAILVVRGGETPKKMIHNSISQLERAGCPLIGIVLSRVEGSGSGYYYKKYGKDYYGKSGYGYGYGYYGDHKDKKRK